MPRIYVIDDDMDLLKVVKSLLLKRGFDVYTFTDWEIATNSMRIFEPQLILLDVFLAGIDGLDVCQKLKASPFTKHIPILLFSAFPRIAESAIHDYGADDFLAYQDKTGEAIAKALVDSAVKYVVNLSSVGANLPNGTGPITGLYRQEQRLNKLAGINIVHLRPTSFMENQYWSIPTIKGHGVNGSTTPGDIALPTVATKDIGEKAAEFLDKLNFKGHEVFEFTGPKEYNLVEVTGALGKAIGKPDLKYVQFPYGDAKKAMLGSGMKPGIVDLMIEMYRAGNEGKIRPTQPLTGESRGKTTIEEFSKGFAAVYNQG